MKRLFISILACVLVAFGGMTTAVANAMPLHSLGLSPLYLADAAPAASPDWIAQLEKEILPKLEGIFSAEQLNQFKQDITNGVSFRKAFKSLTLTPEQKTELKTLLQSVSKKDALASLTPEQKKQLFMKKKEMFMPTSEEIMDKIKTGMSGKGIALPEGVQEKIDAAMKKKEAFMTAPTEK
jgi:hypothetical protein